MSNVDKYPTNIYDPKTISVDGEEYTFFKAKFNSLYDLYSYLKSKPDINRYVFEELHSESNGSDFAGASYDKALEELIGPPRGEFSDFMKLSEGLNGIASDYVLEYINVSAPGGGYIDIPAYCSGNPYCYKTSRSVYTPKFIRMYITLSYNWCTNKKQVLNRALIVAALVNAFEKAGYIVELNTFELSKCDDEVVNINVNIKNNDETFNKASLFKTLCHVEFLRRILFRVLETMDVENYGWQGTYGETTDEEFVREVLKLDENDIFIDQPNRMDIGGKDIVKDFRNVLERLNLEGKIDVEEVSEEFKKEVAILKRTIK